MDVVHLNQKQLAARWSIRRPPWNAGAASGSDPPSLLTGMNPTPNNTRERAQTDKKKPQLITVGASVLVELAGIEPASARS